MRRENRQRPSPSTRSRDAGRAASGFTLIELLISLAVALVLVLGINEIFSLTSRTIGTGQALSTSYRDSRSAQMVLNGDLHVRAVPPREAPALVIASEAGFAFRNAADQRGDMDGDPSTTTNLAIDPNDGSPPPPSEVSVPLWHLSPRSHRRDAIGFFARGLFTRQTGTGIKYIDTITTPTSLPTTTNEAWIVYGHLALPDNAPTPVFQSPGIGTLTTNPNNFFASQWVLGRNVILLNPNPPAPQQYIAQANGIALSPLSYNSASADGQKTLFTSRYDMAATSIPSFKQALHDFQIGADGNSVPGKYFWAPLIGYPFATAYDLTGGNSVPNPLPPLPSRILFSGNPQPARPLDSAGAALTAPCFLRGCTQFAVEYTGDFVTQASDGTITAAAPDGVPDFQMDGGNRKTRWYGLPRDSNNDGSISPATDVVPLRDIVIAAGLQPVTWAFPFERAYPVRTVPDSTHWYDSLASTDRYVVAWGPDTPGPTNKPTALRVTIALDDPNGRMTEAQTFEYVIELPK